MLQMDGNVSLSDAEIDEVASAKTGSARTVGLSTSFALRSRTTAPSESSEREKSVSTVSLESDAFNFDRIKSKLSQTGDAEEIASRAVQDKFARVQSAKSLSSKDSRQLALHETRILTGTDSLIDFVRYIDFELSGASSFNETRYGFFNLDLDMVALVAWKQISDRRHLPMEIFFGTVVIANIVLVGLQTNGDVDDSSIAYFSAECVFFLLFTIELMVRFVRVHSTRVRSFFRDWWVVANIFILIASGFDFALRVWDHSEVRVGSVLQVLRVCRLIRVVRCLRVVNDLYTLSVMARRELRLVFGSAFLIGVLSWVFGQVACEYVDHPDEQLWGSSWRCTLTFLQIATFDNHTNVVRSLVADGERNLWFPAIFVIFLCLTSMGLWNFLIGGLLFSGRCITCEMDQWEESIRQIRRQIAMRSLASTPRTSGVVSLKQMLNMIAEDRTLKHSRSWWHLLQVQSVKELTSEQRTRLACAACGIGDSEVRLIFDEMRRVRHERVDPHLSLDEFIEGCLCLTGEMSPFDALRLTSAIKSAQHRLDNLTHLLSDVMSAMVSTSDKIRKFVKHVGETGWKEDAHEHGETHGMSSKSHAPEETDDDKEFGLQLERVWHFFDRVFAVFAASSATLLLIQLHHPQEFFVYVNMIVILTSVLEVFLRICTHYQVNHERKLDMCLWIFPRLLLELHTRTVVTMVRCTLPVLLRKPLFVFELTVLGVAVLEWTVFAQGSLRELPVARTLKLVGAVAHIMTYRIPNVMMVGLYLYWGVLCWSVVLVSILAYACALMMVSFFGEHTNNDSLSVQCFGNLYRSMQSLMDIATFSEWALCLDSVGSEPAAQLALLGFSLVAGVGLAKMLTSLLVCAVFVSFQQYDEKHGLADVNDRNSVLLHVKRNLTGISHRRTKAEGQESKINQRGSALNSMINFFSSQVSFSERVTQGLPSWKPFWFKFRARETCDFTCERSTISQEVGPSESQGSAGDSGAGDTNLMTKDLETMMEDHSLMQRLLGLGFRRDQMLVAFQKLDTFQSGTVPKEHFFESIKRIHLPLQGIDVVAFKSILRQILLEGQTLTTESERVHESFLEITERLRALQFSVPVEDEVENAHMKQSLRDDVYQEKMHVLRVRNETLSRLIIQKKTHIHRAQRKFAKLCPTSRKAQVGFYTRKGDDSSSMCSAEGGFE